MFWEHRTEVVSIGPGERYRFSFTLPRVVQLQRVELSPGPLLLVQVSAAASVLKQDRGLLLPPMVIQTGVQVVATVRNQDDQAHLEVQARFGGICVPELDRESGARLSVRDCAKMLGATLGALAMVADQETLREAIAWWNWHPSRLGLVYQANHELEHLDRADEATTEALRDRLFSN